MKRVAANSKKSHFVWEEASAKFKQQRLLEDYLEVQKVSLHSIYLSVWICFALIWFSGFRTFSIFVMPFVYYFLMACLYGFNESSSNIVL